MTRSFFQEFHANLMLPTYVPMESAQIFREIKTSELLIMVEND